MKIWKRVTAVAVMAVTLLSLGACNLFLDILGIRYPKPVPFEQRVYSRPDEEAVYAKLNELETLSADSRNANKISNLYIELTWTISEVQSMYVLATLNNNRDTTNIEYQEEMVWMTTFLTNLQNDLLETEKILCESPCKSAMVSLLGEDYVEYVLAEDVIPDNVMAMINQADEKAVSYKTIASDSSLTQEQKIRKSKELYVELVGLRNQVAAALDWENYAEYSYASEYYRDYLLRDSATLAKAVKTYLSPLYATVRQAFNAHASAMYEISVTGEDLIGILTDYAPKISSGFKSSVSHMKKYGLYDFDFSPNKSGSSFCIQFSEYGDAYMFLTPTGTFSDITTAVHEMGHYNQMLNSDSSKAQNYTQSIDLAEVHSQANELLFLELYPQILNEKYVAGMEAYVYLNAIYAAITGCMVDELERYAYTTPDLTVEMMDAKFEALKQEYQLDPGWSWYDVPHIYESPCYYISYATSQIAALEIWNLSTTDRRKALSTYEECVSYGTRNDFLAVLSYCNLSSPFDDSTIRSIANSLSSEINQL